MHKPALTAAVALFMALAFLGGSTPRASLAAGVCGANPSPTNPSDPSIIVNTPVGGASAQSPLAVGGRARVFEAVVSLALKDANGATIVSGTTMAQGGAPALAPFSTSLAFAVAQPTPACLWVFEASARDGSPVNVVQVPLTLLPPSAGPAAAYAAGWNLVSAPAGASFASALGPLYTFQAGDTAYETLSSTAGVIAGRGYWAYFAAPTVLPLGGTSAATASVLAPAGQWVMVGNPSATATLAVHGADQLLRYDPSLGSYVATTGLAPGQGAWALSFAGGTITVGT